MLSRHTTFATEQNKGIVRGQNEREGIAPSPVLFIVLVEAFKPFPADVLDLVHIIPFVVVTCIALQRIKEIDAQ